MALFVFNLTGSPVILAAGNPLRSIPPSAAPPARGPAVNVTSELNNLSGPDQALIDAQVTAGLLEFEWSGNPQFDFGSVPVVGALTTKGDIQTHDGNALFRLPVGTNGQILTVDSTTDAGIAWKPRGDNAGTQAVYYVNSVTGDDTNDGSGSGTALKTLVETARRLVGVLLPNSVTIYLSGDFSSETWVIDGIAATVGIMVQGERTTLATGTVTSRIPWNHTPGSITLGTITDSGLSGTWSDSGPGGTSLVGQLIVIDDITDPNVGAYAWILRDEGAKTALVSPWLHPVTWVEVTPAVNSTYKVVSLTPIYVTIATAPWGITFTDIHFLGDANTYVSGITNSGPVIAYSCKFDGSYQSLGYWLFTVGVYVVNGFAPFLGLFWEQYHTVLSGFGFRWMTHSGAYLGYYGASVVIGSNYTGNLTNGYVELAAPLGFIRNSNAAQGITVGPGGTLNVRSNGRVWVKGATSGTGITVNAGGQVIWYGGGAANTMFDFTGAANDFVIGGTPKTLAALGLVGYVDLTKLAMVAPA